MPYTPTPAEVDKFRERVDCSEFIACALLTEYGPEEAEKVWADPTDEQISRSLDAAWALYDHDMPECNGINYLGDPVTLKWADGTYYEDGKTTPVTWMDS